jgi:hypothetical protein
MKTRLLKKIHKDHRFKVEHRFYVAGYPYSGWWYLEDMRVKKSVRHKRLKNVLNEYIKYKRLQCKFRLAIYSVLSAVLIIIAMALRHT